MASTFMNRPWIHFLLIGGLLYVGQFFYSAPTVDIIEPLSAQEIAKIRGQWLRTTGRPIKPQQLQLLVDSRIDQEILFAEAVKRKWHLEDPLVRQRLIRNMRFLEPDSSLGDERLFNQAVQLSLHKNDLVVRRRLIQMMELSAFATVRNKQPGEAILQSRFQASSDQFIKPATVGFEHIFINNDKHVLPLDRAHRLLASFSLQRCVDNPDSIMASDAFLHGLTFQKLSSRQAERYFGPVFVEQLLTLAAQKNTSSQGWLGPLSSSYGQHLICLHSYQPPESKLFADVRHLLLADWQTEQQQLALRALMAKLREHYQVGL